MQGVLYLLVWGLVVKIPSLGRHRSIYPLLTRSQQQTKIQFHQNSPWGTNEFVEFACSGWARGYWQEFGWPQRRLESLHPTWLLPHGNTHGSSTSTNLHQPASSNSSQDPQGMCSCGRIVGRWLGSLAGVSDESPVTLPWPPPLRKCHPSTNQMVNDGLSQASTPDLMKIQDVSLR